MQSDMTASGSTFTPRGHVEVNELSPLPLPPLSFHQIWNQCRASATCVASLEAVEDQASRRLDVSSLPAKGASGFGRLASQSVRLLQSRAWRSRLPLCSEVTDNNRCLQVPTAAGGGRGGGSSTRHAAPCGPLRQTQPLMKATRCKYQCTTRCLPRKCRWPFGEPSANKEASPVIITKGFGR